MERHQTLFDWKAEQSVARRDAGLSRVVAHDHEGFLGRMRLHAVSVALRDGSVTIDDCREYAERIGVEPASEKTWGGVFCDKRFINTGVRRKSRTPSANARKVTVWALSPFWSEEEDSH